MPDPRVAIVTGAARGIGAATAQRLGRDGAWVAVLDVDEYACAETVAQITDAGGTALAVGADVADPAAVEHAVETVAERLGPPVVLVNNAGITRDNLLFRMSNQDWDSVIGVHLRGAFLMSRAVQAHMTAHRWGRIINVSSVSALGLRGQANYSTAKAGLQGLTKTLAIELGRFNVTANAVAPGFIATDMTRQTAERIGVPWQDYVDRAVAAIPVGRVGEPADVAAVVSFLAGEESGFVSGQVIYAAGGPRG